MTLADIISAHMPSDIQFCDVHNTHEWHCMAGDGTKVDRESYAQHVADAILAAFPALADMLPEADCTDCGEWKPKDRMQPTFDGDWLCGACIDAD